MKPTFVYKAQLLSVHDGDTVTVDVDLGFRVSYITPLRLYGINAPELATPEGKTALAYIQTLLAVGDTVTVQTFKQPGDKYGRWLAVVINKAGLNVNDDMVASGHAVVYF